jgi:CheY-like chemotaxis protein
MAVPLRYDVVVAGDGIQALDSCCDAPPDMVLKDVDVPVIGGLEASEHLCAMQRVTLERQRADKNMAL